MPITKPDLGNGVSHPARFSDPLLPVFAQALWEQIDATRTPEEVAYALSYLRRASRPQWEAVLLSALQRRGEAPLPELGDVPARPEGAQSLADRLRAGALARSSQRHTSLGESGGAERLEAEGGAGVGAVTRSVRKEGVGDTPPESRQTGRSTGELAGVNPSGAPLGAQGRVRSQAGRKRSEGGSSPLAVCDVFAGTGRIHELAVPGVVETVGIEIEPEWANMHPDTLVGDALDLPFSDESFDAICTSPTYGNRLADHHDAKDGSVRRSYKHDLGRELSETNSGAMHWGPQYRDLHRGAWKEAYRVLKESGLMVLNLKDHIRKGERQYVAGWHVTELCRMGFTLLMHFEVSTKGLRQGTNTDLRVPVEQVYVLEKGSW